MVIYKAIIIIALFCHGITLKKSTWPRGDLNPRRRYQSTDMLASRPSFIPPKRCFNAELSNTVCPVRLVFIIRTYLMNQFRTVEVNEAKNGTPKVIQEFSDPKSKVIQYSFTIFHYYLYFCDSLYQT